MRFVAGKGAVAELLLAWSRSGAVASRGAVTERHREDASRGAVAELLLARTPWLSAIGKQLLAGDAMVELLLAGPLQRSTARV